MALRLLDLFCGAGGAARGYQQAGFHVTGVDINPQPRYAGDEFHQGDAMTFPLDGFDAVHASPPCHDHSSLARLTGHDGTGRLLGLTRERLVASGLPYVIENVPGASMEPSVVLCGEMFGLGVRRHRWFESRPLLFSLVPPCRHDRSPVGVYGHPGGRSMRDARRSTISSRRSTKAEWDAAMGIDWMTTAELAQAIPPAYTEFIGEQLLRELAAVTP